jgi:hypothetical protein
VLPLVDPTTPTRQRHRAITPCGFRLFPVRSPLLGESRLLSLPRLTEMFQFGRFPPQALCVQTWVTGHDPGRVSPFGHPRITAFLAAPRGFSQPDASFIGSWRQGIHREPLVTWPVIDARARYRVLKVLEVARTPRTEQCARPACPCPRPFHSLAGCTEAVDMDRFSRVVSAIDLGALPALHAEDPRFVRDAKAP